MPPCRRRAAPGVPKVNDEPPTFVTNALRNAPSPHGTEPFPLLPMPSAAVAPLRQGAGKLTKNS